MGAYERTQHATLMWFVVLPVVAVVVAAAWFTNPSLAMLVPVVLAFIPIVLVVAVFARLTIRADANAVRWYFGWGWPRGAIAMGEIQRAEVTRTNWQEGWGIHWTSWHGWLWNAGGFQAVELFKSDGSRVTLGTDDPQGLLQAIERFRRGAA